MDLLANLLFDTNGGAVGEGSIEAPPHIAARFPSVRERTLALLLSRDPRLQGSNIGIAGERIAPGIHAGAQGFRIHVERPIGAFLRRHLGALASEVVTLRAPRGA
jgi:hypothetical protein